MTSQKPCFLVLFAIFCCISLNVNKIILPLFKKSAPKVMAVFVKFLKTKNPGPAVCQIRTEFLKVETVAVCLLSTDYCRSSSGGHEEKPSNVLFFTIYNPKYPITVVGICINVTYCTSVGGSSAEFKIAILKYNVIHGLVPGYLGPFTRRPTYSVAAVASHCILSAPIAW